MEICTDNQLVWLTNDDPIPYIGYYVYGLDKWSVNGSMRKSVWKSVPFAYAAAAP